MQTPKLTIVRSARKNASTDHLTFADHGWSATPLCGAMKTGARQFPGGTSNCTPCAKEARRRCLDVDGLIRISPRVWNLIKAVREYAIEHYDEGGWDLVVEAYGDGELADLVRTCRTAVGAVDKVAEALDVYVDRRELAREHREAAERPAVVAPVSTTVDYEDYSVERWPGKVGYNTHDAEGTRYTAGFFVKIDTLGYCDHKSGICYHTGCRHEECIVPF